MKKSLLLAAGLLVGTSVGALVGTAVALTRDDAGHAEPASARAGAPLDPTSFRVADDHRRDRDHDRRAHRRGHDDDDDDDDDDGDGARGVGRTGRMPVTGPTDPATPVPDNGLFQGKARPKVEVNG